MQHFCDASVWLRPTFHDNVTMKQKVLTNRENMT